ncbi:MAG: GNAT family N-acetyltransferase [Tardiphaga sp.]
MAAADQAFCRALFEEQRAPLFAPLGLSAQMLSAMLDQQFRAQKAGLSHISPDAGEFLIARDNAPVGRVVVDLASDATGITLRLIDIAIVETARGQGIGSDVIGTFARAAQAQRATSMTLSVLKTNSRARQLYERLGFAATATTDAHVTMVKALP